jgi:TPR repeat protein
MTVGQVLCGGTARRLLLLALACMPLLAGADHIEQALEARLDKLQPRDLPALERRAARGHPEAQVLLGEVYHRGTVVKRDDAVAARWFTRAAKGGSPQAQYWLGRKYDLGEALNRDQALAADWYRRAAEQGLAPAQNRLGELYVRGLGVDQDFAAALDWFGRAVEQDDPDAENNLAAMYYHGRGVDRDYQRAFVLFHDAARDGNDGALLTLGNMTLHGLGTERSLVDAYRWYGLASHAEHGDERTAELAEAMIERLGPHLSETELDQALAETNRWPTAAGPAN